MAVGVSAGGYLAQMAAFPGPEDGLDGPDYPEASGRVRAVISLSAPRDLTKKDWSPMVENDFLAPFLGERFQEGSEAYRKASPVSYVSSSSPPWSCSEPSASFSSSIS